MSSLNDFVQSARNGSALVRREAQSGQIIDITQSTMSAAEADELVRLRAENAALRATKAAKASGRTISLKVTEKGGLSVYGLGRFPVTLYREQWAKLLDVADDIRSVLPSLPLKAKA